MTSQPTNSALQAAQPTQPAMAPNAQPPAENPLDKLRDIHLPEPIDSFPYAPGWWILLGILLLVAGYFVYQKIKYERAIRLLKPARKEISTLRAISDSALNSHSVSQLLALLKRVCLIYFPRNQVASISGAQWLQFLNKQSEANFFSEAEIDLVGNAPYQRSPSIDTQVWSELLSSSEACIEEIIRREAKKKMSIGKPQEIINRRLSISNEVHSKGSNPTLVKALLLLLLSTICWLLILVLIPGELISMNEDMSGEDMAYNWGYFTGKLVIYSTLIFGGYRSAKAAKVNLRKWSISRG